MKYGQLQQRLRLVYDEVGLHLSVAAVSRRDSPSGRGSSSSPAARAAPMSAGVSPTTTLWLGSAPQSSPEPAAPPPDEVCGSLRSRIPPLWRRNRLIPSSSGFHETLRRASPSTSDSQPFWVTIPILQAPCSKLLKHLLDSGEEVYQAGFLCPSRYGDRLGKGPGDVVPVSLPAV